MLQSVLLVIFCSVVWKYWSVEFFTLINISKEGLQSHTRLFLCPVISAFIHWSFFVLFTAPIFDLIPRSAVFSFTPPFPMIYSVAIKLVSPLHALLQPPLPYPSVHEIWKWSLSNTWATFSGTIFIKILTSLISLVTMLILTKLGMGLIWWLFIIPPMPPTH